MPFTSSAGSRGESVPVSRHAGLALALVLAAAFVTPLSLRALNRAAVGVAPGLGYLPALELSREHRQFNPQPLANLSYGRPAWVFIGDSMMGTRVDPLYLGEISSSRDEIVAFLFHPATGPAWWYLAFKNHLVPSGVKPRAVFVFFRDTNLTDTLFRLESLYGNALDEVAHAQEPELNALVAARKRGVWSRVHTAAVRAYQTDVATGWMEPALRRWFVNWRYPDTSARLRFDQRLNERFDLANLRSDVAADLSAANDDSRLRPRPADVGAAGDDRAGPRARHHAVLRPRPAPAGRDGAAAAAREPEALHRRPAGLARGQRRAVPRRLGRPRAARVDLRRRRPRARPPPLHRGVPPPARPAVPMIFHSLDFAAFFLIVVTIYWRLPHRAQNLLLLAASYLFYGWVHPWFVAIMLASTTVDYWAGQRMEDDPARKRRYLIGQPGREPGHARRLQVLQLLRRQRS